MRILLNGIILFTMLFAAAAPSDSAEEPLPVDKLLSISSVV